ncbi:unnamed protein product [Cyprideis torosa]|uniref:Uncharacterized protein n=1 Tax=Cyprideis torosa TaxID=163714 RepID=A0A7R8W858_9CRUS|nr:unnamed protein product [Cyprideis torosa]CAG0883449.1 unnamed protein product [Cyprideis torosa]
MENHATEMGSLVTVTEDDEGTTVTIAEAPDPIVTETVGVGQGHAVEVIVTQGQEVAGGAPERRQGTGKGRDARRNLPERSENAAAPMKNAAVRRSADQERSQAHPSKKMKRRSTQRYKETTKQVATEVSEAIVEEFKVGGGGHGDNPKLSCLQ